MMPMIEQVKTMERVVIELGTRDHAKIRRELLSELRARAYTLIAQVNQEIGPPVEGV